MGALVRARRPTLPAELARQTIDPALQPWLQGDLDSLCGLYVVVNAVRLLYPEFDRDAATTLFRKLVKTLDRSLPDAVGIICDGIDRSALEDLLVTARERLERHHGVAIRIEPLTLWRKRPTLSDLWDALVEQLRDGQVAIVELQGRDSHWSVAYGASPTELLLFDTSGRRVLARAACTLQKTRTLCRLRPKGVLLMRRLC